VVRVLKGITLGVLLISIIGCAPSQTATADSDSNVELNEQSAVELVVMASQRVSHALSGGNLNGSMETFEHDGTEYRYLGEDIGTKDKLLVYMHEVYSPQATEAILSMYKFIEHNGRMAQPNADGGSLLEWADAQARLIEENETEKVFELKVPVGDEKNHEFEVKQVKFVLVEGKGWKVDQEL